VDKNDGENRKSRKEGIGKLWREYIFGENEGIENDGEKKRDKGGVEKLWRGVRERDSNCERMA
jgi:hypothetical protein